MCQNRWWALELLWCPSERSKHTSQQEDFKSQVWGAWWEVRVCWGRCVCHDGSPWGCHGRGCLWCGIREGFSLRRDVRLPAMQKQGSTPKAEDTPLALSMWGIGCHVEWSEKASVVWPSWMRGRRVRGKVARQVKSDHANTYRPGLGIWVLLKR